MTSAALDVAPGSARFDLDVMVEDLVLNYGLKPDDGQRYGRGDLLVAAQAHRAFILENLTLRDADGIPLGGEVTAVDTSRIAPEGVHGSELMAHTLSYTAVFPLQAQAPPRFLTVSQDFRGAKRLFPAVMELVVLREGVQVYEPTNLESGQARVFSFDWTRPPEPLPVSWRQRREMRRAQQREKLGITSYSSLYSFFYITDHEVRHEVLVPLLTLETWLKVERADPDWVEVEEQVATGEAVRAFLARAAPVRIDGVEVAPVLSRLDFYGLDFKDFAQAATRRRVGAFNARVGAILTYSTQGSPGEVVLGWTRFNPHVPFVRTQVYAHDAPPSEVFLVENEPAYRWLADGARTPPELEAVAEPPPRPELNFPLLAFALAVAAAASTTAAFRPGRRPRAARRAWTALAALSFLAVQPAWEIGEVRFADPLAPGRPPPPAEADAIFRALHKNVYRAFDYRREEPIYDALAQSVAGDLLERLYLDVLSTLKMQEQGGAVSRIKAVEILSGTVGSALATGGTNGPGDRAFGYTCTWTVEGTVEHWGHLHTRKNQYQGDFRVEVVAGGWRITRFELLEERRVGFETGLRM